MNFGEVIQAWKDDHRWIDGLPNPYVKKDITGVMPSPITPTEVIVSFAIVDRTYFAEGNELTFQKELTYPTVFLGGTEDEKEGEANRLRNVLNKFLQEAIEERQQQINDLRNKDIRVLTTNPYGW